MTKASVFLRFLGGLAIALAVLLVLLLRVTSCAPLHPQAELTPAGPSFVATAPVDTSRAECAAPAWIAAAERNAGSVRALPWAPFGRDEVGWEIYVPLIQHEIGTSCPAGSEAFAAALSAWGQSHNLPADGIFSETLFSELKAAVQGRREFIRLTAAGTCPDGTNDVVQAGYREGYSGKPILIRPMNWLNSASEGLERLMHGRKQVAIVGFSMGGLLALHLCAAHPDQVSGLVTISLPISSVKLCTGMRPSGAGHLRRPGARLWPGLQRRPEPALHDDDAHLPLAGRQRLAVRIRQLPLRAVALGVDGGGPLTLR